MPGFGSCSTLLLDEIGDLPLAAQAKLLRVLQERVVEPLGGGKPVQVDVRVLAATHHDLAAGVADQSFRQDLYYRLRVVELELPPLSERGDDVLLLARHFLALADRPGRRVRCLPTAGRGSDAAATGAAVLKSDPKVDAAGVDTGYSPAPNTLRAPDVAVGNVPREPGWVRGVPPLAVEYADTGQDENDLQVKIEELLDAGTQLVWVVRLVGLHRVEIHQAGRKMTTALPGEELRAPGILQNPVPVEALYDWEVGREVTLRNLLQRHGYDSLETIEERGRAEGEAMGRAEGEATGRIEALRDSILDILTARGLAISDDARAAVEACDDQDLLKRWHRSAVTAATADEAVTGP